MLALPSRAAQPREPATWQPRPSPVTTLRRLSSGAVLAGLLLLGACGVPAGFGRSTSGEAVCAAVLELGGLEYTGHGELRRIPATTGETRSARVPACDDGNGVAAARTVEVAVLADVPARRAVLAEGALYVRAGRPFPEAAREWFVTPECATDGGFRLAGEWLAVGPPRRPRSDGDLRPPYRLEVRVDEGPNAYVDTVVDLRVTADSRPRLGRDDVRTSLWEGGRVSARVHCEDGRFVADAVSSAPGGEAHGSGR